MNIHTGEVRPWDSLTEAEKASGYWIKIPDGTEGGFKAERDLAYIGAELNRSHKRAFDAMGKAK